MTTTPQERRRLVDVLLGLSEEDRSDVVREVVQQARAVGDRAAMATWQVLALTRRRSEETVTSLAGEATTVHDEIADAFTDLRLRTQARRAVLDVDMLTSAAIAQALGGRGRNQREIASRLRTRGVLLGLHDASRRGYLYPAFQVDVGNERVHPVVAEVNRHLDAARDPWGVGSWWVSAHPRLDGAAPMDLLGTEIETDLLVMNGLAPVTKASDVRAAGR